MLAAGTGKDCALALAQSPNSVTNASARRFMILSHLLNVGCLNRDGVFRVPGILGTIVPCRLLQLGLERWLRRVRRQWRRGHAGLRRVFLRSLINWLLLKR